MWDLFAIKSFFLLFRVSWYVLPIPTFACGINATLSTALQTERDLNVNDLENVMDLKLKLSKLHHRMMRVIFFTSIITFASYQKQSCTHGDQL